MCRHIRSSISYLYIFRLDIVVEPWIESLLHALANFYHILRIIPPSTTTMTSTTNSASRDDDEAKRMSKDLQSSLQIDDDIDERAMATDREVLLKVTTPRSIQQNSTTVSLICGTCS